MTWGGTSPVSRLPLTGDGGAAESDTERSPGRPRSGSRAAPAAPAGGAAARCVAKSTPGSPARAGGPEAGSLRERASRARDVGWKVSAVASCLSACLPKSANGVPESSPRRWSRKPLSVHSMSRFSWPDRPEGQAPFWHLARVEGTKKVPGAREADRSSPGRLRAAASPARGNSARQAAFFVFVVDLAGALAAPPLFSTSVAVIR